MVRSAEGPRGKLQTWQMGVVAVVISCCRRCVCTFDTGSVGVVSSMDVAALSGGEALREGAAWVFWNTTARYFALADEAVPEVLVAGAGGRLVVDGTKCTRLRLMPAPKKRWSLRGTS